MTACNWIWGTKAKVGGALIWDGDTKHTDTVLGNGVIHYRAIR